MAAEDPYAILGVSPDADSHAIDKAYRREMAIHHPDRAPADGGARARAINAAHDLLSDPHERAAYDRDRLARMAHHSMAATGPRPPRDVRPAPIVPREMRPGAFDPDRKQPLNLAWLLILFASLLSVFLWGIINYA